MIRLFNIKQQANDRKSDGPSPGNSGRKSAAQLRINKGMSMYHGNMVDSFFSLLFVTMQLRYIFNNHFKIIY